MTNIQLTQELVKYLFDYRGGNLYWINKCSKNSNITIGTLAGGKNGGGRFYVRIKRKKYILSRIIFLWHNGYLPKFVDHIDRDGCNNKIENLREATPSQNACNRTCAKGASSKYLGVHHFLKKKWHAAIRVDKKLKSIGYFKTQEDAALAYNREAVRYHKEFANLNIISL